MIDQLSYAIQSSDLNSVSLVARIQDLILLDINNIKSPVQHSSEIKPIKTEELILLTGRLFTKLPAACCQLYSLHDDCMFSCHVIQHCIQP